MLAANHTIDDINNLNKDTWIELIITEDAILASEKLSTDYQYFLWRIINECNLPTNKSIDNNICTLCNNKLSFNNDTLKIIRIKRKKKWEFSEISNVITNNICINCRSNNMYRYDCTKFPYYPIYIHCHYCSNTTDQWIFYHLNHYFNDDPSNISGYKLQELGPHEYCRIFCLKCIPKLQKCKYERCDNMDITSFCLNHIDICLNCHYQSKCIAECSQCKIRLCDLRNNEDEDPYYLGRGLGRYGKQAYINDDTALNLYSQTNYNDDECRIYTTRDDAKTCYKCTIRNEQKNLYNLVKIMFQNTFYDDIILIIYNYSIGYTIKCTNHYNPNIECKSIINCNNVVELLYNERDYEYCSIFVQFIANKKTKYPYYNNINGVYVCAFCKQCSHNLQNDCCSWLHQKIVDMVKCTECETYKCNECISQCAGCNIYYCDDHVYGFDDWIYYERYCRKCFVAECIENNYDVRFCTKCNQWVIGKYSYGPHKRRMCECDDIYLMNVETYKKFKNTGHQIYCRDIFRKSSINIRNKKQMGNADKYKKWRSYVMQENDIDFECNEILMDCDNKWSNYGAYKKGKNRRK